MTKQILFMLGVAAVSIVALPRVADAATGRIVTGADSGDDQAVR